VDEATAMAAVRAREADELRQREEVERKRKAAEAEKQRKEEARRNKLAAEKKRKAELQRKKAEAEKKRQAEQKRKKEEAEKQRLAEEKRKQEEAEHKRRQDEDKKRREQELQRQMAEEAERLAAEERAQYSQQLARERDLYIAAIESAIQRKWQRPPGSAKDFRCKVLVKQIPSGDVIDVRVVESCGNIMLNSSVESAVRNASPLPLPANRDVYESELEITFVPE
jgi:colicin import membrane protein